MDCILILQFFVGEQHSNQELLKAIDKNSIMLLSHSIIFSDKMRVVAYCMKTFVGSAVGCMVALLLLGGADFGVDILLFGVPLDFREPNGSWSLGDDKSEHY